MTLRAGSGLMAAREAVLNLVCERVSRPTVAQYCDRSELEMTVILGFERNSKKMATGSGALPIVILVGRD